MSGCNKQTNKEKKRQQPPAGGEKTKMEQINKPAETKGKGRKG
jgi:hypothetical protein